MNKKRLVTFTVVFALYAGLYYLVGFEFTVLGLLIQLLFNQLYPPCK